MAGGPAARGPGRVLDARKISPGGALLQPPSPPLSTGSATCAIVAAALIPARAEPTHRAERVTEWVCGEVLDLLDRRDAWCRTRGSDGYEAWVGTGGLALVEAEEARRWADDARLWSLGTELRPAPADGRADSVAGSSVSRLPWGSRVVPAGEALRLPDGSLVIPRDPDRLIPEPERARRFPSEAAAIVASASTWLGVPYSWGGRTELGADCSGFVQAVYALHGVALPRDSRDQRAASPELSDSWDDARPADLLFFAPEGKGVTHVALCLDGREILHAAAGNGRVAVDDLAGEAPLARRLHGSIVARTRPTAAGL